MIKPVSEGGQKRIRDAHRLFEKTSVEADHACAAFETSRTDDHRATWRDALIAQDQAWQAYVEIVNREHGWALGS